jgi:hypothetical protein
VDKVQIDIKQWQTPRGRSNHMLLPNFFKQCVWHNLV